MDLFENRNAFVTGGASGIGLGIAKALARRGVNIVLADIEATRLDRAAADVASLGVKVHALPLDVSDRAAFYRAAQDVERLCGSLQILVNNAGVAHNSTPLHETSDDAIDWSFSVNVFGVLNGVKAMTPLIIRSGQGGHIVNTSSIGGFQVRRSPIWRQGLYAATKFAVVALSEGLRQDLEPHGVGVSVLAPSHVATDIAASGRNRQQRFGGPTTGSSDVAVAAALSQGMNPELVGEQVARGIRDNQFYIFTHLEGRDLIEARHQEIMAAFEATRRFHDDDNLTAGRAGDA
jgi:NAD(P)-dependent dehydrogenase (short-subunit alcohol dehydrogenase family)